MLHIDYSMLDLRASAEAFRKDVRKFSAEIARGTENLKQTVRGEPSTDREGLLNRKIAHLCSLQVSCRIAGPQPALPDWERVNSHVLCSDFISGEP